MELLSIVWMDTEAGHIWEENVFNATQVDFMAMTTHTALPSEQDLLFQQSHASYDC